MTDAGCHRSSILRAPFCLVQRDLEAPCFVWTRHDRRTFLLWSEAGGLRRQSWCQGYLNETPEGSTQQNPKIHWKIRRVQFQTPSSVSFCCPHRVLGRELSEFLSPYYFVCKLTAKANSPSFSQNSPRLPQNSLSSLFQTSNLETAFHPSPTVGCTRITRTIKLFWN